jgi:kelch-like protein 17 (actinfilin)
MFTSELLESRQGEVTLQGVDPDAMEMLVEFAYTAKIQVSEDNVQTLLPASSLLQLNSVRNACCEFLTNQLHPSNCLGIRSFADAHVCKDLLESSHKYALNHFVDVCQTEEFLLLNVKQIHELISSDDINVKSEEQVFNAVISWINYDKESRKGFIHQLLPHVRLALLSRECLMTRVETEDIIRSNQECKDLLIEAMKYHLLPEKRSMLQSPRTKPRSPSGRVSILFAIGGGSLFAIHSECECYDPQIEKWCMIAPMSTKRARVGVGVIDSKIYAVGGYDGSSDLASVEGYCPQENQWSPVTPMGTRRSCLGVAVVNGLIYAVGGYDGASCLNSTERYDPLTEQWTSVAAMSMRRYCIL